MKGKAGAYADNVHAVCSSDKRSVRRVFLQYEKLTCRSGLELKAEKTKIMALNGGRSSVYDIE